MAAFKSDHDILRDYITASDHLQYTQLPDGVVAILMTHSNLSANHLDIRLDLHLTISEVKERFRKHVGTPVQHQRLLLKSGGQTICEMSDNNKKLGYYSVVSGNEIHIIDTDPFSLSRGGGLTDTSLVEKYKMSEDAYDKRKGTMRDFIREKRKTDPNFKLTPKSVPPPRASSSSNSSSVLTAPPASGTAGTAVYSEEEVGVGTVSGIAVGNRCEVVPGGRRGVVMFVGEIEHPKSVGYWVGVKFDEPVGHNDGSIRGIRKFECAQGYGAFVRGGKVTVGDFPERDEFADSEDDEENKGAKGSSEQQQQQQQQQQNEEEEDEI